MTFVEIVVLFVIAAAGFVALRVYFVNGIPCKSKKRLNGKTVIVTGGNTGIGKVTVMELSRRGAHVILACRDTSKGQAAIREIKATVPDADIVCMELDLASLRSVRRFADQVLQNEPKVHILVNNAGVMFVPYQKTEDGYELQFAVNHLGHFLITSLLLDRIKESAPSRIINVSSHAHYIGYLDFNDMMWTKRYNAQLAYGRSKLANVMFTRELATRLVGTNVTVCSLHPGTIHTELTRYFFSGWMAILKPLAYVAQLMLTKTPWQGAQTTIHCAVADEVEGVSGKYWDNCSVREPVYRARDDVACKKLWDYSAELLGLK
eukprot:Em0003g1402a